MGKIEPTLRLRMLLLPFWALLVCVPVAGHCDTFEPDNTMKKANAIDINDPENQHHDFHAANDEDWVKFYVYAGDWLEIGAEGLESNADPILELYDSEKTLLCTTADLWCRIDTYRLGWLFAEEGLYFIRVTQRNPEIYGEGTEYELFAWDGKAPDFPSMVLGQVKERCSAQGLANVVIEAVPKPPCTWVPNPRITSRQKDFFYSFLAPSKAIYTLTASIAGYAEKSFKIQFPTVGTYKTSDITLTQAKPDLQIQAVTGPSSGTRNGLISVEVTVKNGGSVAGNFSVGVYLSKDKVMSHGTDTLLKSASIAALSPCAQRTLKLSVKIPAGMTPGVYYLGAIADNGNVVDEAKENNNTRAASQKITVK
jgi:hypothetical protein